MRLAPACALAVLAAATAVPQLADAQILPSVPRRGAPQRTADQPPVPTVMRPAEGEVVVGDLVVAVQVPPNVPAREYTLEAAYWDAERNNWVYPGTIGSDFAGGTTATTRIAADVRLKLSRNATRWRIHARVTQPPGSWGEWREFTWQAAPAVDRTAPAAGATPVATPTNTATTGTGEGSKPGIMVPGSTPAPGQPPSTTTPSPGPPDARTAPTAPSPGPPETQKVSTVPNPGPPDARTAPTTPNPGPPETRKAATTPDPGPPDARKAPTMPEPGPPDARKTPVLPNPGPPDARTAPPAPPSTNLPAVQQPPTQALPQVPRRLPAIPGLPMRLPTSLPKTRSGGTTQQPAEARTPQRQTEREARPVSMTKLAVWDGKPMPAANLRVYVRGPVDVDWAKKSLQWWFRGLTTAPGAVPGKWRWEMSRTPFASYGPWHPTPGLGYAGAADGVHFFINLNPYAPRPSGWAPNVEAGLQPEPTVAQPGHTPPPTFSQHLNIPPELLGTAPGSGGQRGSLHVLPQKVPVSLSLFVRVVPLDAAGNDADLPSNSVELRFGPAEKAPPFDMNPKQWPVVSYVSYRPVQGYAFDWQCWVEASTDITAPLFWNIGVDTGTKDAKMVLFKKGTTRNICGDDDDSIVDDFVDAMGGFLDMLGSFVDWASKTYSDLKNKVASTIAGAIPGCASNPACQGAVQMGLNAGMAALGMPPDLPDFEQLQAMGEGYLVDAIAQQVAAQTNVPFADVAAKEALKEFIEKGKEAMQGGNGGGGGWIPDDSKQYKPLLLTLAVSNPSTTGATPAMYLEVREPGGKRYLPRTVAVPSLAPAQSVKVSVALDPVSDPKAWMELLPTEDELLHATTKITVIDAKIKQAKADLQAWRTTYLTGSVPLQAALKLPPFVYKLAYTTSCMADKPACVVQAQ